MNSTTTQNALNPTRATYSVIGNLCENPHLLREPEIEIAERDFSQEFHKIVFGAINNLAYSSYETTKISEVDIDNYLAPFPQLYKIWEKHDGMKYVRDSIEHAAADTFRANYSRLKKFSLLRHYVENGIDVSDIFDYKSIDLKVRTDAMKALDKMSTQDIIEHYSLKLMKVKSEFSNAEDTESFMAGDGADDLLEQLNKEPEFGNPFKNGFYNKIFRGKRKTKFMLRSAGTGTGKTRQALADMCNAAADELFDLDKMRWVSNGPAIPTLYISTEIDKQEVQTILIAFISGVDEDIIKDGGYGPVILERLQKAIQILKRIPLYCEYISDFSIADIEEIIERYILEENIQECAFDYIQMTPKLSRTMMSSFGTGLREDQILVQFSAALKTLAKKYDIFMESSTQLNRSAKDAENRDTQSLRGGSATADKVDHGILTFKVTAKDHDNLKHILERGFYKKPNYSHWVYKNRGGTHANVIVWTHMNLGTMREEMLFVTDIDYNPIDIQPIDIDYMTEDENVEQFQETKPQSDVTAAQLDF